MKSFIIHKNFFLGLIGIGSALIALAECKVVTQTVELSNLCQKFPHNSRCEGYVSSDSHASNDLSVNSQILVVQLDTLNSDTESVLIEIKQEAVGYISLSISYIERFERGELFSSLLDGGIDAAASSVLYLLMCLNSMSQY